MTTILDTNVSPKSRLITLLLCLCLGVLGVHRYYVGKIGTGLLMLCTGGGLGIWWVIDLVFIVSGSFRDRQGRRIIDWTEK